MLWCEYVWVATIPCGGGGGLGVLPQEHFEIGSALSAILGLF